MTPEARIAAAIDILDEILADKPAESALKTWARGHRFAGSKDRAALRDHVFDALRCLRSYAALGGARSGRGLMLGALRAQSIDPETVFTGQGYAPRPLEPHEQEPRRLAPGTAEALDCPDWLLPLFREALEDRADAVLDALRARAPIHLRVNLRKSTTQSAIQSLAEDHIAARPVALSDTALEITEGARRLRQSQAFAQGAVELQDAASQAVSDLVPLAEGAAMLDLCAGGGGKTLAVAGRRQARYFAYDINPRRMMDLPARAQRAGVTVNLLQKAEDLAAEGPYDLVLVDAPCSGSGSWRRDPQGKWALTPQRLDELCAIQAALLDQAAGLTAPGGALAYVTCSLLRPENAMQIEAFLARQNGWQRGAMKQFTPLDGGDGFFVTVLTQSN